MKLFTYILDFRGGTYISQVQSDSLENSLNVWILQIEKEVNEIKYLGHKTINQMKEMQRNGGIEIPTKLIGLNNVWYNEISTSSGYLRINIVLTSND